MLRSLRATALLLLMVGLLQAAPVLGQQFEIPSRPSGPVLDQADLLSRAEEQQLSQKLRTYETETSTAIVVVTIPSLDGAPIADYAVELGRQWGVGADGKDNGAVVLISRGDRKMFIATGYGLEGGIPDAVASDLVRNVMRPAFRRGNFYDGIDRATSSLMLAARGEYTATDRPDTRRSSDGGDSSDGLIFVIIVILYFVLTSRRRGSGGDGGRKRRRGDVFIWGSPGGFGGGSSGGGFGGGGFGGFGGGSFGGGGAGGDW